MVPLYNRQLADLGLTWISIGNSASPFCRKAARARHSKVQVRILSDMKKATSNRLNVAM